MFSAIFSVTALLYLQLLLTPLQVEAGSASPWFLSSPNQGVEVERDETLVGNFGPQLASEVVSRRLRQFNRLYDPSAGSRGPEEDLFECIEPTRALFESFASQYNRTFVDSTDKLQRLDLFETSFKRAIVFNRIIQNEILNQSNYDRKVQIGNYHFISPLNERNLALWYADITDCELGLIKKILFDIIYLIDKNELGAAYRVALDNSQYLPLLNDHGFQQLTDILLLRLYDRFRGDQKMDQLFRWPHYLKRLAAYAYNRREAATPDFKERLALISFAYPHYFKDLKYNLPAVNRTGDNLKVYAEYEKFNKLLRRKFSSLAERDKRLAIFRQRWTLVNLLNEDKSWQKQNVSLPPDWLQLQYHLSADQRYLVSERLTDNSPEAQKQQLDEQQQQQQQQQNQQVLPTEGRFKHTQFSDLSDTEFVAYLTNDFSMLEHNKESANFIDTNFPVRPLDGRFRAEIAAELEQRSRLANRIASGIEKRPVERASSAALARKVVEELISDVGLPVGAVVLDDTSDQEVFNAFNRVANLFGKPYASDAPKSTQDFLNNRDSQLKDERLLRYERFKTNYGRFRAWHVKEGWQLSEERLLPMLRLADLSWHDIKLSLFKVCCLTEDSLAQLAARNTTLRYLSHNRFLCQQLNDHDGTGSGGSTTANGDVEQVSKARELAALELYYYYSVHFNKHHTDMDTFNRRFAIFKDNVDRIRHHSCTRNLTLYRSLKLKTMDTLNTVDSLDARRSYTDDLNLDRFRYFQVINLYATQQVDQYDQPADNPDYGFERIREGPNRNYLRADSSSRAGISYRRDAFFNDLLESRAKLSSGVSYANKLASNEQNANLYANRYRENSVSKVYELVMQRYRYCAKMIRQVKLDENLPQQCQSSGPLSDQASASRLYGQQYNLQLQTEDQCAFYRLGLEPWAEGLIKQDLLSANLIHSARCQVNGAWR